MQIYSFLILRKNYKLRSQNLNRRKASRNAQRTYQIKIYFIVKKIVFSLYAILRFACKTVYFFFISRKLQEERRYNSYMESNFQKRITAGSPLPARSFPVSPHFRPTWQRYRGRKV